MIDENKLMEIMVTSMAGSDNYEEQFEAWQIDLDAIGVVMNKITEMAMYSIVHKTEHPKVSLGTVFMTAFELGYRSRLLQEMENVSGN